MLEEGQRTGLCQTDLSREQAEQWFTEMRTMKQHLLAVYPDLGGLDSLSRRSRACDTEGAGENVANSVAQLSSAKGMGRDEKPRDTSVDKQLHFGNNEVFQLPGSANLSEADDVLHKHKLRTPQLPPMPTRVDVQHNPGERGNPLPSKMIMQMMGQEERQCPSEPSECSRESSATWAAKADIQSEILATGADGPRVLRADHLHTPQCDDDDENLPWTTSRGRTGRTGRTREVQSESQRLESRKSRSLSPVRSPPRIPRSVGSKSTGSHLRRTESGSRNKRHMRSIDNNTGQVFPTTVMRSHSHGSDGSGGDGGGLIDEDEWTTTAENAYGIFIHVGMQKGMWSALADCGPMLVVSVLIQFTFAYELWRHLPDMEDSNFCEIPWDLQLAAVGVFMTLMLNNLPGVALASGICLFCTESRTSGQDVADELKIGRTRRWLVFLCAVMTECATFAGVVGSGVQFILTAESVDMLIRSTVAIIFVQNVDEIVFEACCPDTLKDEHSSTKYRKVSASSVLRTDQGTWDKMMSFYGRRLHLPLIVALCCAVVLGIRYTTANCPY